MAKDIEEFLKMAAARRRAAQKGDAPPSPTTSRKAEPPAPAATAKRPPSASSPKPPVRSTVGEHVRVHLDTSEIAQSVEKLGDRVELADDVMDAHLHEVFDHRVGHLEGGAVAPPVREHAKSSAIAQLIHRQLASPVAARQAVIVSEILQRPNWD